MPEKKLQLGFHGRVIDHLGIEMYQSPVAALAELVSNAWDADAESVNITLPAALGNDAAIVITDTGVGMTFKDIQERYLNVGYNRRGDDPNATSTEHTRPVMGRKGIGKFAGFGIATVVDVTTTAASTGERTTFRLDLQKLRGDGVYVADAPMDVEVLSYDEPDEARKAERGTTVVLQNLTLKKTINAGQFGRSMARRFLLLQRADDFDVTVNGEQLPEAEDLEKIEFSYPKDYREGERPDGIVVDGDWAIEDLPEGKVRWRVVFYKDTISDEELQGIAVFAHGKLAQRPFLFNLTGGFGGQAGTAYMSGKVEADYIDEGGNDLIATERQRVNWEREETQSLLEWGQNRIKGLLRLWQTRRSEDKVNKLKERIAPFADRVGKKPSHERKVLDRALMAIAKISTLSEAQFEELADAILTAWEGGKLYDLINAMADSDEIDEASLLALLAESNVLNALHVAEKVKLQIELVSGLRRRIEDRDLENAVRDYIAENPWLIAPQWEMFKKELGIQHLVDEALAESGLAKDVDWNGRVDLVLAAGPNLLVLEFMRPGLTVNWDHLSRFEHYVFILRGKIKANESKFERVAGLLVADHLERGAGVDEKLDELRKTGLDARDWRSLLARAEAQWRDFFDLLRERAPDDERLQQLADLPADTADESAQ